MASSPAIGRDGSVYLGSHDGKLYSISANGTVRWTLATGGYVTSSPAIGADGTIYVGSWDGLLYAVSSTCGGLNDGPWPMAGRSPSRMANAAFPTPPPGASSGQAGAGETGKPRQ
jgi:hypothetical protein